MHHRGIYASHLDGLWTSRSVILWSVRAPSSGFFVHRLARLFMASFRPCLAAVALASTLGLHLHQVGQRTFTSKVMEHASTQRSRSRGGSCRVLSTPAWGTILLKNGWGLRYDDADGYQNCYRVKSNNDVLAKNSIGQRFSGRNRLNSPCAPRASHRERLPSDGGVESELPRSRPSRTAVTFASDAAFVPPSRIPKAAH